MRDANGYGLPTPNPDTNPAGGIGNTPDPSPISEKGW